MDHRNVDARFAKAVARALYPPSQDAEHDDVDMLWSVIADDEQLLCKKIASAVLLELRQPTSDMLSAADGKIRQIIDTLSLPQGNKSTPEHAMNSAFKAMVDKAHSEI